MLSAQQVWQKLRWERMNAPGITRVFFEGETKDGQLLASNVAIQAFHDALAKAPSLQFVEINDL